MHMSWVGRGMVAALLLVGAAAQIEASPIVNSFGLLSPDVTITFSEHALPTETTVTNQFADLGVTFDPGMYYDVQPVFFPTASLSNFSFTGADPFDPVTIHFTGLLDAVAVAVQTNPGLTTFTALLNGVVVESFTAGTAFSQLPSLSHASDFFGFSGIAFNELQIAPNNTYFQIDNLKYSTAPVPEPGTLLLLGSGVAGLVARARRRKA
jgi:PEP-CTERM motif